MPENKMILRRNDNFEFQQQRNADRGTRNSKESSWDDRSMSDERAYTILYKALLTPFNSCGGF